MLDTIQLMPNRQRPYKMMYAKLKASTNTHIIWNSHFACTFYHFGGHPLGSACVNISGVRFSVLSIVGAFLSTTRDSALLLNQH